MKHKLNLVVSMVFAVLILSAMPNTAFSHTINGTGVFTDNNGLRDSVLVYNGDPLPVTISGTGGTNHTDVNFSGATSKAVRWTCFWRLNNNNGSKTIVMIYDFSDYGITTGAGMSTDYKLLRRPKGSGSGTTWTVVTTANVVRNGANVQIQFPSITVAQSTDNEYTIGSTDSIMAPLPVKLIRFDASKNSNGKTLLTWQTASEMNSNYFEIQNSTDEENWNVVGTVKAAGNSSSIVDYSFETNTVGYFRLNEVDYDGINMYSNIRFIKNNKPTVQVYYNPSKKIVSINETIYRMQILNIEGKEVAVATENNFCMTDFPSGIYLVEITLKNNEVTTSKIVVN